MKKLTMKSLRQLIFGDAEKKENTKRMVKKAGNRDDVNAFTGKIIPYRRNRKPELL